MKQYQQINIDSKLSFKTLSDYIVISSLAYHVIKLLQPGGVNINFVAYNLYIYLGCKLLVNVVV